MKNSPRAESDPIPTALGPATSAEETAVYIQRIIDDAVKVGQLSGCTPQYVLQGISEAMVDSKELDNLAKTWVSPLLPAAIIAIPMSGSGSNQPSDPADGAGIIDASASAKGMKLTKILQASQDNPSRQSCVGFLISVVRLGSAFRGGHAIRARVGNLVSRCAFHAAVGIAICGGAW